MHRTTTETGHVWPLSSADVADEAPEHVWKRDSALAPEDEHDNPSLPPVSPTPQTTSAVPNPGERNSHSTAQSMGDSTYDDGDPAYNIPRSHRARPDSGNETSPLKPSDSPSSPPSNAPRRVRLKPIFGLLLVVSIICMLIWQPDLNSEHIPRLSSPTAQRRSHVAVTKLTEARQMLERDGYSSRLYLNRLELSLARYQYDGFHADGQNLLVRLSADISVTRACGWDPKNLPQLVRTLQTANNQTVKERNYWNLTKTDVQYVASHVASVKTNIEHTLRKTALSQLWWHFDLSRKASDEIRLRNLQKTLDHAFKLLCNVLQLEEQHLGVLSDRLEYLHRIQCQVHDALHDQPAATTITTADHAALLAQEFDKLVSNWYEHDAEVVAEFRSFYHSLVEKTCC